MNLHHELERSEITTNILTIATSLLEDELYTREDAARDLVIILQENRYIQSISIEEVKEIESELK